MKFYIDSMNQTSILSILNPDIFYTISRYNAKVFLVLIKSIVDMNRLRHFEVNNDQKYEILSEHLSKMHRA